MEIKLSVKTFYRDISLFFLCTKEFPFPAFIEVLNFCIILFYFILFYSYWLLSAKLTHSGSSGANKKRHLEGEAELGRMSKTIGICVWLSGELGFSGSSNL